MDPWNILGWILVGLFVLPLPVVLVAGMYGLIAGFSEAMRSKKKPREKAPGAAEDLKRAFIEDFKKEVR